MAKMRENKYLCDMNFTQSDQCFRNKYDVNTNINSLHDCKVMLLLSRGGHLSVYQDGNISTDLVRNFCLRTDCFRDLFTQRYSSFSTAQGEVNLPRAAQGWLLWRATESCGYPASQITTDIIRFCVLSCRFLLLRSRSEWNKTFFRKVWNEECDKLVMGKFCI